MELGALICTPRQPNCDVCPVARHCVAFKQGRVHQIPNLGRRTAPIARRFAAFVLKRRERFLVRRRPANVVNAHLWEFPNIELNGVRLDLQGAARNVLKSSCLTMTLLFAIKHSITRYRITLEVFEVKGNFSATVNTEGRWLKLSELKKLSFPSAHKKIIAALADHG